MRSTSIRSFVGVFVRENWRGALMALAAGVVLAFLGPLGSYPAPLEKRLAFWVALLLSGSACAAVLTEATRRRPAVGSSPLSRWMTYTVVTAIPMGVASWGLARLLFASQSLSFAFCLWASLLISGASAALMISINSPGAETKAVAGQIEVRLRQRLPLGFRAAEIFAVAAEDHYLRVHTSVGSTLILLRLSDAIAELNGIEGAQVHRSWWVARSAVRGSRRSGRNITLVLTGDLEAPVSRANVRVLHAEGWIEPVRAS